MDRKMKGGRQGYCKNNDWQHSQSGKQKGLQQYLHDQCKTAEVVMIDRYIF